MIDLTIYLCIWYMYVQYLYVCVFHEVIFHFCTVSAATIEEGAAWLCNGAQPLGLVRKAGLTVKGIRAWEEQWIWFPATCKTLVV